MLEDALFALWFLLPAAAANVAPIFSAVLPYVKNWQTPIDGGLSFRGKRILGSHKTWRGVVSGFIIAWAVVLVEQFIAQNTQWGSSIVDGTRYLDMPSGILAVIFTIGALGGDALKSFFKRQLGVEPGRSWFPFDQIDYILGTIMVTLPFIVLPLAQYVWIFIIWTGIHLLVSYAGWRVGLKERPI